MDNSKGANVNKEALTGQIIRLEQKELGQQVVRGTMEHPPNELLDAEADLLCQAARYARNDKRKDTRAGYYHRKFPLCQNSCWRVLGRTKPTH